MARFKLSACGRWMGIVGTDMKGGGVVNILNAETLQWVAQARVESRNGLADFAWWSDGNGLTLVGKGGEVGEWDNEARRIVARWTDEGAVGITTLALGGSRGPDALGRDRWVAIGSTSGIVTVYDRKPWTPEQLPPRPTPFRALEQLVTPTSHLVFSADGQLLAMGSRWKKDALRLGMHLCCRFSVPYHS